MSGIVLFQSQLNYPWGGERKSEEWVRYRAALYIDYCLPALRTQTNSNCLPWLDCSDDPLPPDVKDQLIDAGAVLTQGEQAAARFLKLMGQQHASVVISRIDSDDVYSAGVCEALLACPDRAMQFLTGYRYDLIADEMHEWSHFSPPFYAIRYTSKEMIEDRRVSLKLNRQVGHGIFRKLMEPTLMPAGMFCVLRHQHNSSVDPEVTLSALPEGQRDALKTQFGLEV